MQSPVEKMSTIVPKQPRKSTKSTKKGKTLPYIVKGRNDNIPCIISKPEQGKKTIEMAKLIEKDTDDHPYVLSIYISQPRINQANKAAEGFMEYILKNRGIVDMPNLHGQKDASKDADGFTYRAMYNNERLISGLANKTRLEIIKKIIEGWLGQNKLHIVKVYCDEAQKTFPPFMKNVYTQLKKEILNKIHPILIDAHVQGIISDPLYKQYFNGRIYKLKNDYDLSNYLFMRSMPFIDMNWQTNEDILASYTNQQLEVNTKDYILWPLPFIKVNQCEEARNMVKIIPNSSVLLINGDAYHVFSMSDNSPVPLHRKFNKKNCKKFKKDGMCNEDTCSTCFPELNNSELNIVKKLKEKYAKDKTFILCGHHCIDRAMTYYTPEMPFTKAFIASDTVITKSVFGTAEKKWIECSITKQEDISQMIKRLCASFKSIFLEKGIPLPIFYGPEDIYNGVCDLEDVSKTVAGLNGYIDESILDNIKYECKVNGNGNLNLLKIHTKTLKDLEQPIEYYYKSINCVNKCPEEIQRILSDNRTKIGGERVALKTITSRLHPVEAHKHVTGKYIEDMSKTPLTLNDFKLNHEIIKAGLNEETNSRVRICFDDDGNTHFTIVWSNPKGQFIFDNHTFNLIKIPEDGNCLFNCFIKDNITKKTISRLRGDAASHIEDNLEDYEDYIKYNIDSENISEYTDVIRKNGEWNNDISDILPQVLSNILQVNVYIYDFNTNLASGGEELLFDEPVIIPENKPYKNNIYLKHSNGLHYDLFEIFKL
jgi:hypothetical protein